MILLAIEIYLIVFALILGLKEAYNAWLHCNGRRNRSPIKAALEKLWWGIGKVKRYDNTPILKEHQKQLMADETKLPFPIWLKEKNPSEYKRWKAIINQEG